MRTAIIGNGIVAAFAAAAARDSGATEISILGTGTEIKPPPPGAFYLHEVPGVPYINLVPAFSMLEMVRGSDLQLYGRNQGVTHRETSIQRMPPDLIRGVFRPSAEVIQSLTSAVTTYVNKPITVASELHDALARYDRVILTVNIPQNHQEKKAAIVHIGVVDLLKLGPTAITELGNKLDCELQALIDEFTGYHNVSVYNAESGMWLRMTKSTYGDTTTLHLEFPDSRIQYLSGSIQTHCVRVPKLSEIVNARRSTEQRLILAGRFGTWNRKDLSHEAYHQVRHALLGKRGHYER